MVIYFCILKSKSLITHVKTNTRSFLFLSLIEVVFFSTFFFIINSSSVSSPFSSKLYSTKLRGFSISVNSIILFHISLHFIKNSSSLLSITTSAISSAKISNSPKEKLFIFVYLAKYSLSLFLSNNILSTTIS